MEVLKQVLAEIKPTKEDEILIAEKIKDFISKVKVKDAKIILGGSGAKETWLKDAKDVDIFVQFNYNKYKDISDGISDVLEKQLKKSFKIDRLHGSRDYFQVKTKEFTFEIIPILEVKKASQALNITDVSPLHADFVKKYGKGLFDEIRLMKQFCKANNVYGAESYIKGFSGYMCELLVINYKSFLGVLRAASKWKEKEVIDIKKFYKGKNILLDMNKSKTYSPLILVDPVQADRNAAAALNFEKYDLFRKKSKEFLKKKSVKFFEEEEFDISKKKDFIVLEVISLKGKEDVVGAKLLKAFDFIKRALIKEGFKISKDGWVFDRALKAYFYFKIPKDLDKVKIIKGPSIKFKEHVSSFKKKHKNNFVKNSKVYAKDKRKFVKAKDLVKELIKEKYVKERVKSVRKK